MIMRKDCAMGQKQEEIAEGRELALFQIKETIYGVNTRDVQEINQNIRITRVHRAPDYVRGVINLRGEIVTVIDLREKFGLPSVAINEDMQVVVVRYKEENIGLLVDSMLDVISVRPQDIMPPPANLDGAIGSYFEGVYQMTEGLVAIVNLNELLKCTIHF